ncbi:MAG: NIPSNAP family protein [Verrucomicrobiota bacterium]
MLRLLSFLTLGLVAAQASAADTRLFEMRVYFANEGKLDALHARFRDHTMKLFEKHGMTNLGYFVPAGANPERKLVYFLAYPDKAARDASWKGFMNDPAWKKAFADSHTHGVIVARVENAFLTATNYSALAEAKNYGVGAFELRTYTTEAGRLPNLNTRFRDHTLKLFEKHGMTNVTYWNLAADQKGAKSKLVADNTLIYLLTHKSEDAAKASFGAFRADPAWIAAKEASEKKAGGSLTIKDGVKSEFLVPTDYSPVK